jgi:transposase
LGMDKVFRAWEPGQGLLLPPSIDEFVPEGHLAHFVREVVRRDLDLGEIYAAYDEPRGYPPYHPALMTALLLYAYTQGIRSSRKIEEGCRQRVDFMAVTALAKPDHDTINEFRRRHLSALERLFVQVLALCQREGLTTLEHVAVDGTKVLANASKHKAMSYGRMEEEEKRLRASVRKWFEESDAIDREEDKLYGKGKSGNELPAWTRDKEKRAQKVREAKAALEAEAKAAAAEQPAKEQPQEKEPKKGAGKRERSRRAAKGEPDPKAQFNFTDPESRVMHTRQTFEQSYNAQLAVDAHSQVIVACHVTNRQRDAENLIPMVQQVRKNLGRSPSEVSADAGYCSEENLAGLRRHRVRGYVATGGQRHGTASATSFAWQRKGPLTRAMRSRLKRGAWRSRYRLRKQTVEPVIGQMKEARGFRRFLLRGLAKVRGEWSLACMAHNLLKLFKAAPATA